MRFIYALDPMSITEELDEALKIAFKYFDRIYGTDSFGHEVTLIAAYDYRDTHEYPKTSSKNSFVYLIKGSPNRGVVIARDLERYFSITVDSLNGFARIYVLKDPSRLTDFKHQAYRDFLVGPKPMLFATGYKELVYDNYTIRMHLGLAHSIVELEGEKLSVWPIDQRRPLEVEKSGNKVTFTIPTFAVPFAIYDVIESSKEDLLARLIREVYGF